MGSHATPDTSRTASQGKCANSPLAQCRFPSPCLSDPEVHSQEEVEVEPQKEWTRGVLRKMCTSDMCGLHHCHAVVLICPLRCWAMKKFFYGQNV